MESVVRFDLAKTSVRELNHYLHHDVPKNGVRRIQMLHPHGQHNIAVGLDSPITVEVLGNAGYFTAGMNKQAELIWHGNIGWSVAENMM